jgi:hypothetical protein
MDSLLKCIGFSPPGADVNYYVSRDKNTILLLHVDDIPIASSDVSETGEVKFLLHQNYKKMTNTGLASRF